MNITYLLGAGASAGTLPVVKELESEIGSLLIFIRNEFTIANQMKSFVDSLEWLNEKARTHSSIDTFAKKLWLNGEHRDLHKLKKTLSVLFAFWQCTRPVNKKYDLFLATILEKDNFAIWPKSISVLTWNYDFQIELAAKEYNDKRLTTLGGGFGSFPYISSSERPNIIHLNGIAGTYRLLDGTSSADLFRIFSSNKKAVLQEILFVEDSFEKSIEFENLFSFGWEENIYTHDKMTYIKSIAEETQVLIIIGYSFPDFNYKTDMEIFSNFKNLEKIYIQNPSKINLDSFKEKYDLADNFPIKHFMEAEDISSFYIPKR